MEKFSKYLSEWLIHSIGTRIKFSLVVLSHIIFGIILFFEIGKGSLILTGMTIAAVIIVPVIYLHVLKTTLKEHGKTL